MQRFKQFINWDKGLDWVDSKPGTVSTEWTRDEAHFAGDYKKPDFVEYLMNQAMLWRVFRRILERKYTEVHNRQYNFKENANVKESMLYHEGYKQALQDIHKLIPRPRGKE